MKISRPVAIRFMERRRWRRTSSGAGLKPVWPVPLLDILPSGDLLTQKCPTRTPARRFNSCTSSVVRRAQRVDCLHQHGDLLRIDVGMDAVTEVEHVPAAATVAREERRDLRTELLPGRMQRAGVEVALQRDAIAHTQPRRADVDR